MVALDLIFLQPAKVQAMRSARPLDAARMTVFLLILAATFTRHFSMPPEQASVLVLFQGCAVDTHRTGVNGCLILGKRMIG